MTTVSLSSTAPERARADALVVGLFSSKSTSGEPTAAAPGFEEIAKAAATAGASGKTEEVLVIPGGDMVTAKRIITVGLGDKAELSRDRVRRAAGVASKAAAGDRRVVSTLGLSDLEGAVEGHVLGAYQFAEYKDLPKQPVDTVVVSVEKADRAAKATLKQAVVTAEATARARDFVNAAPNHLSPEAFAQQAADAARANGLQVQVMTEKALARGGYGGILAVGSGSTRPPRLLRITYKPNKSRASVALVGKGVTFDSGGISIKPAAGMENMTSDMAGAAAVVAVVIAAAELELPVTVTATVPMAENMVSGTSYRPGDVLSHRGGKTVHVLNTDAEGRLLLADAIVRACEDDPDYLLEASTLTGAQVVALGNRTMGVMGTPELRDRVAELGREVGEGAWAMPLPEELRSGLDSPVADIANISWERAGGMLAAGHYLSEFVADGLPWAHIDVAGPAFNTGKPYGYTTKGGTGVPVRTLLATLADIGAGNDLRPVPD